MTMIEEAVNYIDKICNNDIDFKRNIDILDSYDFSEFLIDGINLWSLREAIEEKYDKEFWDKYHMYAFDNLSGEDTCQYFASRYNVWFQEYTDWVVRHDNGTHEKTTRRVKNSSGEMA